MGSEDMAESIMLDKAKDFAVEIINMCKDTKETKINEVKSIAESVKEILGREDFKLISCHIEVKQCILDTKIPPDAILMLLHNKLCY